jgi:ADP-ribosylglycohydrolase
MEDRTLRSVKNSALWAAYGDALGFITEFRDDQGVWRRINAPRVTVTVPWQRVVGGRFGTPVDLPAGTYSDDTQLRLATSRAIQGDGHFDAEAFAKVELPVWRCYSLGAGKGTKAAAVALTRQDVNWFSNFFDSQDGTYMRNGGNGAAMRVQPHVWSSRERAEPRSFIGSVIRNAVCTHGHPRGILGAVFHSVCLAATFDLHKVPPPDFWVQALEYFRHAAAAIRSDGDLSTFWLPAWEERIGTSIEEAFEEVRRECVADIQIAAGYAFRSPQDYKDMVQALGGLSAETRGSGTKTALIAAALSFMYRDADPAEALQTAANLLLSDTDTIGTMCGAQLGAVSDKSPVNDILDRAYIEAEATRIYEIACGNKTTSFGYPDLGQWRAPYRQVDSVGWVDDNHKWVVSGLGFAEPFGKEYRSRNRDEWDTVWQWLRLDFGQSIVAKRRAKVAQLPYTSIPNAPVHHATGNITPRVARDKLVPSSKQPHLFTPGADAPAEPSLIKSLDELSDEAIRSGFDPATIGKHVLELSDRPGGIELAVAYASIIVKARMARSRARRKAENRLSH